MAHQLRKILLAIDGSDSADCAAAYLAREAARLQVGEVDVLNVQGVPRFFTRIDDNGAIPLDMLEFGNEATADARGMLDAANVKQRLLVRLGEPAETIVAAAQSTGAEEIVLGRSGTGALSGMILGSVAYKTVHLAQQPVTVVCSAPEEDGREASSSSAEHRVLLAVDRSASAAHATEYVCGLLAHGARIAIDLINVSKPMPALCFEDGGTAERYYREQAEAAVRHATEALQAADARFDLHVEAGDAASKIVEVAQRRNCTRIVMGTRGMSSLGNLVLGSVAYMVLQLSTLPVTLVK